MKFIRELFFIGLRYEFIPVFHYVCCMEPITHRFRQMHHTVILEMVSCEFSWTQCNQQSGFMLLYLSICPACTIRCCCWRMLLIFVQGAYTAVEIDHFKQLKSFGHKSSLSNSARVLHFQHFFFIYI